jgi:hypothetical protein
MCVLNADPIQLMDTIHHKLIHLEAGMKLAMPMNMNKCLHVLMNWCINVLIYGCINVRMPYGMKVLMTSARIIYDWGPKLECKMRSSLSMRLLTACASNKATDSLAQHL